MEDSPLPFLCPLGQFPFVVEMMPLGPRRAEAGVDESTLLL
jgi:hypothetical protein